MKITKLDTPEKFVMFKDLEVGQFFTWPGSSGLQLFLKLSATSYTMITVDNEVVNFEYVGNSKALPIEIVEIQYRLKD